jgi:hypothetical protein
LRILAQLKDDVRNRLGGNEPPAGCSLLHAHLLKLTHSSIQPDPVWNDTADSDLAAQSSISYRGGEPNQARLGRCVLRRSIADRPEAAAGRDIDHSAASTGLHQRQAQLRGEHRHPKVEIKTLEPAIGVWKLRARKPTTCVVDQDLELAEPGGLQYQIPHSIGIGGVRTHEGGSTTLDLNRVNELRPGYRVDVSDDDVRPRST